MKSYLTIFCLLLLSFSALQAEESKLETAAKKSIQIFAGLKRHGDQYIFQCIGVDALGRVMLLRRVSSDIEVGEIKKYGFEFTSYLNAKIISREDGHLEFLFEESTAGSSLTVIGKDGKVKDIFSIPKGVFADSDGTGYFANIVIKNPEEMPVGKSEEKWMRLNSTLLLGKD